MAGALDAVVQLVLFACFALYVVMGIGLIVMGGLYIGEVGEAGDTAVALLLVGLVMLVVGAAAIFGNAKKGKLGALILFVVEVINMLLFVILYIFIIAAVMMALGINDPVRKGTVESWNTTRPELESQGYCKETGYFCNLYYLDTAELPTTCALTPAELAAASTNCAVFSEYRWLTNEGTMDNAWIASKGTCGSFESACKACDKECMEHAIKNVKDYMVPGAVAVLLLSFYSIAAVVINAWVLSADEIGGLKKTVGLIINGLLTVLSLLIIVLGVIGMLQANDNCKADDCTSWSSIAIIVLGLVIFVVGGLATFAMLKGIAIIVRVANLLIIIFGLFLLLAGVAMGLASGTLMGDLGAEYDANYPAMRTEVERVEPSYCQLSNADGHPDCADVTNGEFVKICDGNADVCTYHDTEALWQLQYAAIQDLLTADATTADPTTAATFSVCQNPTLCIHCKPFFSSLISNSDVTATDALGPDYHARYPAIDPFGEMVSGCYWTSSSRSSMAAASYVELDEQPDSISGATTQEECAAAAAVLYNGGAVGDDAFDFVGWSSDVDPLGCVLYTGHPETDGTTPDYTPGQVLTGEISAAYAVADGALQVAGASTCSALNTTSWQANVNNHTRHDEASSTKMSYCRTEVESFASDVLNEPLGVPAECKTAFFFDDASANDAEYAGYQVCVDWLVPYVATNCNADIAACRALVVDQPTNFATALVALPDKFCQFPDDSCKRKIRNKTQDEMATIGTVGCFFLIFFMVIIYFTQRGIKSYLGGDGGDDDDEDGED